jgi:hypothetical protein
MNDKPATYRCPFNWFIHPGTSFLPVHSSAIKSTLGQVQPLQQPEFFCLRFCSFAQFSVKGNDDLPLNRYPEGNA